MRWLLHIMLFNGLVVLSGCTVVSKVFFVNLSEHDLMISYKYTEEWGYIFGKEGDKRLEEVYDTKREEGEYFKELRKRVKHESDLSSGMEKENSIVTLKLGKGKVVHLGYLYSITTLEELTDEIGLEIIDGRQNKVLLQNRNIEYGLHFLFIKIRGTG